MCGCGQQPDAVAPAPTATAGAYGGATYGGARYDHTAELKLFHERIAPIMGPAGAKRRTDACAASAPLATAAKAITQAPVPAGANPTWSGEANELQTIAEDLGEHCAGKDVATIDYDIDSLQRSFERLMKLLPTYKG
jgi:hypothetical protein